MKEQRVVLFHWFDGGFGWLDSRLFCFVVVLPWFFIIPSRDDWEIERIFLQDFCNSSLHKSVLNVFKIVITFENRIYFEKCKEFKW